MISKQWWFVLGYVAGVITLAAMLLIHHWSLAVTRKADRIDTFNVRWMPMLPQIRTDLGAPHCVVTRCRIV